MNRKFKSDIHKVLATRRLYFLVALVVLSIPQLGHAQSCDAELKKLRDWVNKPKSLLFIYDLNFEMATVTDRSGKQYVTYSKGILTNISAPPGIASGDVDEFFSDRVVVLHSSGPDQPFDAKKTANLNVEVNLNSGEIKFTKNGSHTVASPECFSQVIFWHTDHGGYLVNFTEHTTNLPPHQ